MVDGKVLFSDSYIHHRHPSLMLTAPQLFGNVLYQVKKKKKQQNRASVTSVDVLQEGLN